MKVVIAAEHASAKFGGEAFLPLHYFRILRNRGVEAWLVVHSRTQQELEALFPDDRDRIYFIADTWIHKLLWQIQQLLPRRIGEATLGLLSHLYTQFLQRQIVKELVKQHQIDVVHEPIPVSPKQPSLIFDVGAPVVIGPMNGGIDYPPGLSFRQGQLVDWTVKLGRLSSNLFNRLLPGKLRAKTLLVANERTHKALPLGVQGTVMELVENGVDLAVWQTSQREAKPLNQPVRFVFMGRLVDWKAVDLLLLAFQGVASQTDAILEIIGEGKMRQEWEALAQELGLAERVIFSGWLPQKDCALHLQQADVMVLSSLMECGGAVVLEAMAIGLPVIATNWGGPADYLDSTCGILVNPTSKDNFIDGLKAAMLKLAQSPELRMQMGLAGQKRVQHQFNWDRKVDVMLEIYKYTCTDGRDAVSAMAQPGLPSLNAPNP